MKLSQITDAQWINIFNLRKNGYTVQFIAGRFNIDAYHLQKIFEEVDMYGEDN